MGALGYTLQAPLEDRYLMNREELLYWIANLLGRVAEKVESITSQPPTDAV